MKKKGKVFRNALIFIILIALTFYILLKDQNPMEILKIISSAKVEFVLIGILCMFIYIVLEAVNIRRTLKNLNEETTFLQDINANILYVQRWDSSIKFNTCIIIKFN